MREPPTDLSDSQLADNLRDGYGLPIDSVQFLPLGHDAHAWVYRADANGAAWFVKVRRQLTNEAALIVPHYLADNGIERVVAPLAASDGRLSARAGHYALIVYPYVSDRTGLDHGMSDAQWTEYGTTLRQIHETGVSAQLRHLLRVETFTPDGAALVEGLAVDVARTEFSGPGQATVARFWRVHGQTISLVLEKARAFGSRLEASRPPIVLCHADIHTNNVLVDGPDHVAIVDWDETMLAPRERDLMFVVGGIAPGFVNDRQTGLFFDGYGHYEMDPLALAYYRYAWAVSDIASYGDQVFHRPDLGPKDAREAVDRFQSLFTPGSIVDIALKSEVPSAGTIL